MAWLLLLPPAKRFQPFWFIGMWLLVVTSFFYWMRQRLLPLELGTAVPFDLGRQAAQERGHAPAIDQAGPWMARLVVPSTRHSLVVKCAR